MVSLHPGSTVGEAYRVIRPLGCGGMGVVYLVEDIALKSEFAMKIAGAPSKERAAEDAYARFFREAQCMAKVKHHAVVPVFRCGIDGASGAPYYIMPHYVLEPDSIKRICAEVFRCPPPIDWSGDEARPLTVADLLDGHRALPEVAVATLGLDVLAALEAIHRQTPPMVHRDVKPSNLLVDVNGKVLLSDFGIVKPLHATEDDMSLTHSSAKPGSPQFSSPEQRGGGHESLSPKSDFYSYGLVLFRALTGGMPSRDFHAELPSECRRRVSSAWAGLFEGLLEPDPAKRLHDYARIRQILLCIERSPARRALLKRRLLPFAIVCGVVCFMALALHKFNARGKSSTAETQLPPSELSLPDQIPAIVHGLPEVSDGLPVPALEEDPAASPVIAENNAIAHPQADEGLPREVVVVEGAAVSIFDIVPIESVEFKEEHDPVMGDTLNYTVADAIKIRIDGGTLSFALPGGTTQKNDDAVKGPRGGWLVLDVEVEVGPKGGVIAIKDFDLVYFMKPVTVSAEGIHPHVAVDGIGFNSVFGGIDAAIQMSGVYKTAVLRPRAGGGPPSARDVQWFESSPRVFGHPTPDQFLKHESNMAPKDGIAPN